MRKLKPNLFRVGFILTFILMPYLANSHPSWGIVVDKQGTVYFPDITHYGNGSVWMVDKNGKATVLFKDFHSHAVMLDSNDNLLAQYVAKGDVDGLLVRLNTDGSIDTVLYTVWGDEFTTNCGITKDGTLYFSKDHYIWKREVGGKVSKLSDHYLAWTQTLYVDKDENVYIPDIGVDNGRLVRIAPDGMATILARDLIAKLDRPKDKHQDILMGITRGCDDHVYVAELAGQRIIRIVEGKEPQTFYKCEGDWFPTGIDFFSGDAYILEYKTKGKDAGPRITKIDESGNKTILFDYDQWLSEGSQKEIVDKPGSNLAPVLRIMGYVLVAIIFIRFLVLFIYHLQGIPSRRNKAN